MFLNNKNTIENNIRPNVRLYGITGIYFETIDELLKYCRINGFSTHNLTILDYYRCFDGYRDVIRETDSRNSIFYAALSANGYAWYSKEINKSSGWTFNYGQIRELYKPFREYGLVFEHDIYAEEDAKNQDILKYCREKNLFNMGRLN